MNSKEKVQECLRLAKRRLTNEELLSLKTIMTVIDDCINNSDKIYNQTLILTTLELYVKVYAEDLTEQNTNSLIASGYPKDN